MNLRKVLLVYKKSTYQIQAVEHREPRFLKLLQEEHAAVRRVKVAHAEHYDVLESVKSELTRRGIEFSALARANLTRAATDVDLVISVGGDGTFLDASHFTTTTPVVGVNSSISSSFGHFCLSNEANFASILDQITADMLQPLTLLRLEIELNGSVLPELVLNEVLICHSNPAATSRYLLTAGSTHEQQRSGGIWVGPAAGSTGVLKAAGGTILPVDSRYYQYLVREPGLRPDEQWLLLSGCVNENSEIKVVSLMRTGAIYLDGQHIDYKFALGDELIVRASRNDLLAYLPSNLNGVSA